MRRILPPLSAIRPFEAAARLGSFTAAAEEISLTQGAVSHQIRNLEHFLGKRLFERHVRRVELTEEGREFYAACSNALDELESATHAALASRAHQIINVSALPTLAMSWLMPRLAEFATACPGIEVRISTSIAPVDFKSSDIDVALRVGRVPGCNYEKGQPHIDLKMVASWDGVVADYLFDDILVPVIARGLLDNGPAIHKVEDLLQYPLIHTASRQHVWRDWLGSHGVLQPLLTSQAVYGHFFMSLQAAKAGQGIAIVPQKIAETQVGPGSDLVPVWQAGCPSAGSYYLLMRETALESEAIRSFREWVMSIAVAELI
ncbi:LysR substrate-binding domain-containing protein [Comamonas endophytica]|uniref:LysR substrate-binding domain-containing protein n=1 Tax=Comamonas endophytica TaxID=2949090 RepID=A0ABY6G7V0_9BURK|nr:MULTISPECIES: LysR substrate-binding domain-containing protein [unclassified Acidovorax]MCD2514539.1 LysR substrate-binding domain-containing protein [Acidovorax sp. D4N7]UYG51119.1 LysR substrate-binding domain-containing protein [Acidovorax sp. 5MLIR]